MNNKLTSKQPKVICPECHRVFNDKANLEWLKNFQMCLVCDHADGDVDNEIERSYLNSDPDNG